MSDNGAGRQTLAILVGGGPAPVTAGTQAAPVRTALDLLAATAAAHIRFA